MARIQTAKLFKNGASQAVRLPAEFRFPGEEVGIRRNKKTGEVILSPAPPAETWDTFFEFMRTVDVPEDYMQDRPLNRLPVERDIFGEK